jgi:hypothetical protein
VRPNLTTRFCHSHGDRIRMDIQSNKEYLDIGDHLPLYAALRRLVFRLTA